MFLWKKVGYYSSHNVQSSYSKSRFLPKNWPWLTEKLKKKWSNMTEFGGLETKNGEEVAFWVIFQNSHLKFRVSIETLKSKNRPKNIVDPSLPPFLIGFGTLDSQPWLLIKKLLDVHTYRTSLKINFSFSFSLSLLKCTYMFMCPPLIRNIIAQLTFDRLQIISPRKK